MVTITDDVEADVSADGKRIVVVMARIHPCDAISSFVIQGQQLSFFLSILKYRDSSNRTVVGTKKKPS